MKRSARPKRKSPRLEGFDCDKPRCYFVTICTFRRWAVFAEARLNRAVLALMANHAHGEGVILHAYSLMPDHLHLLVELPDVGLSLSKWVGRLKGLVSTTAREMGFRGRLWQGRFYDHILRKEECIERVADYIVHNPVRRGFGRDVDRAPVVGFGRRAVRSFLCGQGVASDLGRPCPYMVWKTAGKGVGVRGDPEYPDISTACKS